MTPDAISRRTNVPMETVLRCITELCQPDVTSRSPLEDGKRLIPLDSHRDWGWRIVNYQHYRKIRDQEARRSYFRDYQRKRRKKLRVVKDIRVNNGANGDKVESSSSTSTSSSGSVPESKKTCTLREAEDFASEIGLLSSDGEWFFYKCVGNGWTNNGKPIKDWKATIRQWKISCILPSLKPNSGNGRPPAMSELDRKLERDPLWQEQQQNRRS